MLDGKAIAEAYENLVHSPNDADVQKAYAAFAREIEIQFDVLSDILDVEFVSEDAYKTSKEMFTDIEQNEKLKIFSGGEPHELMADVNLKFRAVHDYFGHYVGKNNFSFAGETAAYVQHSKMFSQLANKALFTETIGQNSWFNFSERNAGKPNALREFAEQKAGVIQF